MDVNGNVEARVRYVYATRIQPYIYTHTPFVIACCGTVRVGNWVVLIWRQPHLKGFIGRWKQPLHDPHLFSATQIEYKRRQRGRRGGGPLKISIKHFHKHVRQIFVKGVGACSKQNTIIILGSPKTTAWNDKTRTIPQLYIEYLEVAGMGRMILEHNTTWLYKCHASWCHFTQKQQPSLRSDKTVEGINCSVFIFVCIRFSGRNREDEGGSAPKRFHLKQSPSRFRDRVCCG